MAYDPSRLKGYFIDMRSKLVHSAPLDDSGVPLARGQGGELFYHPTMICQRALGCYDSYLVTGRTSEKERFLQLSGWLIRTQDRHGGWPCFRIGEPVVYRGRALGVPAEWVRATSPYSGMTQGQAVSVLARASMLEPGSAALTTAQRASRLLRTSRSDEGVVSFESGGPIIEEATATRPCGILNGWIFGMFGLWDYWLRTGEDGALHFFRSNYSNLLRNLPRYDIGWWSLYDFAGHIAKPYYHWLHVCQLRALDRVQPDTLLRRMADRWARASTILNSEKARIAYVMQRSKVTTGAGLFQIRASGGS